MAQVAAAYSLLAALLASHCSPACGSLLRRNQGREQQPTAAGAVRLAAQEATSNQASQARGNASWQWPNDCAKEPAIGKVCSLYYSSVTEAKMTAVLATDGYHKASRFDDIWLGNSRLPVPSCALQLGGDNYGISGDNRKANLRLAELAVCDMLAFRDLGAAHPKVPDCGANVSQGEVCELKMSAPMTTSDQLQEPYTAAALALAAYSRICALFDPSEDYKCKVNLGNKALLAGLQVSGAGTQLGGATSGELLTGVATPGLLDLKLKDAYDLYLEEVIMAEEGKSTYEGTDFHAKRNDVLLWTHAPPGISFCNDLHCLVQKYIQR
eukprot:TRINITY_DN22873_c0_g1_i2.p1 TRINITY_DN22873_c0_g1~~TRINITY_DN22873_c0_g1_i2.p1  ORF type:complete len:325 (+),score=66.79 TRINITY_DN22873_c0_g1_i2:41-1015(+)